MLVGEKMARRRVFWLVLDPLFVDSDLRICLSHCSVEVAQMTKGSRFIGETFDPLEVDRDLFLNTPRGANDRANDLR